MRLWYVIHLFAKAILEIIGFLTLYQLQLAMHHHEMDKVWKISAKNTMILTIFKIFFRVSGTFFGQFHSDTFAPLGKMKKTLPAPRMIKSLVGSRGHMRNRFFLFIWE